jgi:hypothetical protein
LPIRAQRRRATIFRTRKAISKEIAAMSRYLIEREFPDGLNISQDEEGADLCRKVNEVNAIDGVTWVLSYVTPDSKRSFCVYDGPTPEALRRAAARNTLPITQITEVRVLDPYFFQPAADTDRGAPR